MSMLTVEARRIVIKYAKGSITRLRMIRVAQHARKRFSDVIAVLNFADSSRVPRLRDGAVGKMLYMNCDMDRLKSISFLTEKIKEIDDIIKLLEER